MSEVSKTIGEWIVGHVGWSVLIALFLLSGLFKIVKIELDPIGAIFGWIGKKLTKDVKADVASVKADVATVQQDISDLKSSTDSQFNKVKTDREAKIKEMNDEYTKNVDSLRNDLDAFEKRTDKNMNELKRGTAENCSKLQTRLDEMEAAQQKSNDMQTVQTIRAHILDFANSCFNKRKHTKREFENIIDENAKYEELVEKYDIKNNVYKEDYDFIMKCYHKCQEDGSFLTEDSHMEVKN